MIALLLVSCAALPALPQSGERQLVFGEVRTITGAPWVGARVVLRSRLFPALDDAGGAADRIDIVSDERGRFRAGVLPGRTYTVWASGPSGADDSFRTTGVRENVLPHAAVVLRELRRLRRAGSLHWKGLEAWKKYGPFKCRIAPRVDHVPEVVVAIGADASMAVPPLPGDKARIELYGQNDRPIWTVEQPLDPWPATLELPPPQAVVLRPKLRDQPWPGGRFVATWRGRVWPVANVPEIRGATVELPAGARPWDYRLLVRGMAPAILGPTGEPGEWTGRLVAGSTLTGQLCIRREVPAAGWQLVVRHGSYTIQPGTSWVGSFDEVLVTDERGRFALPPTAGPTVWAVLRDSDRARWPEAWRGGVQSAVWLPPDSLPKGDADLTIVLDRELFVADLRVLRSDGAPAMGAHLTFASGPPGPPPRTTIVTDRGGRARVLLPRGDLAVVARNGDEWRILRLLTEGTTERAVPLVLELEPPMYVAGVLENTAGRPAPQVRINLWPHLEPPRLELLGDPPPVVSQGAFTIEHTLDFDANRLRNLVVGELNRQPIVTSDDGRFRCAMPRLTGSLQAHGYPDARVMLGDPFDLDGQDIDDVRLRAPR